MLVINSRVHYQNLAKVSIKFLVCVLLARKVNITKLYNFHDFAELVLPLGGASFKLFDDAGLDRATLDMDIESAMGKLKLRDEVNDVTIKYHSRTFRSHDKHYFVERKLIYTEHNFFTRETFKYQFM